jgi:hypothetical protein
MRGNGRLFFDQFHIYSRMLVDFVRVYSFFLFHFFLQWCRSGYDLKKLLSILSGSVFILRRNDGLESFSFHFFFFFHFHRISF